MAKWSLAESSSGAKSDGKMKRKTPSELRGEQLRRRTGENHGNSQLPTFQTLDRTDAGAASALAAPEPKVPKYINTRVSEVYPVKKSSERSRPPSRKEKGSPTLNKTSNDVGGSSYTSGFPLKGKAFVQSEVAVDINIRDHIVEEKAERGFRRIDNCSQSALRNVVQLHEGDKKLPGSADVDWQKAFKGFGARDIPAKSGSSPKFLGKRGDHTSASPRSFYTEFHVPGRKVPLDLSLKTSLRLVSSSSVKWCHKLSAAPATLGHFASQLLSNKEQNIGCASELNASAGNMYTRALCSWVYPQSSLPALAISAIALSSSKGENDFLSKRQYDWENSFENLYFMFRKNICNIFYVQTIQFVVLFIGGNFSGQKHSCNAYISQSTHGLRSLLKKHDIHFSMPLCHGEVEQTTEDDLDELSEIERRNLGQTFQMDPVSDIDNSPQSLLAFTGTKDVHGLFDVLLNHRFYLTSFTSFDVPVICAPVPFKNASLSVPEVKCREMKRADGFFSYSGRYHAYDAEASPGASNAAVCYSIEIKDSILPPWTISGICAAMSSDGKGFESSFVTKPLSVGLNVALDALCPRTNLSNDKENSLAGGNVGSLGIPEAVPDLHLRAASLKGLKYSNGSYMAYTTPV